MQPQSHQQFELQLYLARKEFEREAQAPISKSTFRRCPRARSFTRACCSRRRSREFYRDLNADDFEVPLIVFHQRYSTNTFPTWARAQPFRVLCHNGEINTLQGNIAWMKTREPC